MSDTDFIKIVPPTSLPEWTQLCVTNSLSDIESWYAEASICDIDSWLLPNFQTLINNGVISVSSVRAAYDVVNLVDDFDGYVSNKNFRDCCDTVDGVIVPKVVFGIIYNINIIGDPAWKQPTPQSHHDWIVEFSDIQRIYRDTYTSVNHLKMMLSHTSKMQHTHITEKKTIEALSPDTRRQMRIETLFFREKR